MEEIVAFSQSQLPVWKGWKVIEVAEQISKKRETELQKTLYKAEKNYYREHNIRNYFQTYISSKESAQ